MDRQQQPDPDPILSPQPRRFVYRAVDQDSSLPNPHRRSTDVAKSHAPLGEGSRVGPTLLQFRVFLKLN